MPENSRRRFLLGAGAGVAVVGTGALTTGTLGASSLTGEDGDDDVVDGPDGPIVAYVRDVKTGQIDIMVGEQEVTITDSALARGLARKAR